MYIKITSKELYYAMKETKLDLIDIREPYEHMTGHVPGAKNIPMNTLLSNPSKYMNKDKTYYIICQSGNRTTSAGDILNKLGYNIVNVIGGHNDWPGEFER